MTESAVDRAFTVTFVLDQECELLDWADQRLAYDGRDAALLAGAPPTDANEPPPRPWPASDDLALVVGPAGTGKTTALRPAVEHLRNEGRAVFGVAPSATAAAGAGRRDRNGCGHNPQAPHRTQPEPAADHRYNLPRGATVIVDEAGMLATDNLAEPCPPR